MLRWRKNADNPDVVPEKIQSQINPKVLLLILGIVVSFQIYLYLAFPNPDDASHLVDVISVINPLIASFGHFM